MNSKLNQPWIPFERIEAILQLEPALIILGLGLGAWLIYKIFLRGVSSERHRNLTNLFKNLLAHVIGWTLLFTLYWALRRQGYLSNTALLRVSTYVGLLTIISGATVFVKTCRILVLEYLFLGHMREGVPLLLVNIFTLLLSIFLSGWIATEVFALKLAPLLATSAIFSLVLGLALQDTLGNLFAGVALQFDKPYAIGDWIEIYAGSTKWVGQVTEITWRATVLIGFSDEIVTIPNRVVAQAEVSNYSVDHRPMVRSQLFKFPHGHSISQIKQLLLGSIQRVTSVRKDPPPLVIVTESHESWVTYKLVYFINDYGTQFLIADQVISSALEDLQAAGISTASQRLLVVQAS